MSSREKPSAVWVRSLVPKEKKSASLGDVVGQEARARQLDHRADRVVGRVLHALLVGDALDQLAHQLELALVVDERDHDLEVGHLARALAHGLGRAHDRPHLHLVDLGIEDPQPHAARAEHRVDLLQRPRAVALRALGQVVGIGQELVQRRVEQADGDRQALHRLEDPLEVALLQRQRARRARSRRSSSSAARITWTIFSWRSSPKNMCSVRHRPMPSAPNSRALRASSGVSALVRTPSVRSSSAHRRTVSNASPTSGSTSGTSSVVIAPVVPSMASRSPACSVRRRRRAPRRAAGSISRSLAPVTAGTPMPRATSAAWRGLAALGGEDPLGRVEARDVVGLGERAREDHVAARRPRPPPRRRR